MISIRNKWLAILGGLMILLVVDVGYSHAWLYYYTPEFKGRITDATTGMPIENAIIEASWVKSVPGIGDSVSVSIADEAFSTDKNGEYHIPSKLSFHFFSWFNYVHCTLRHPLYETKIFGWGKDEIDSIKGGQRQFKYPVPEGFIYVNVEYRDGVINQDMQLLSLAKKYKEKASLGGEPLAFAIFDDGVKYFSLAKNLNVGIDYLVVFQEWDKITERFREDKDLHHWVESAKNKIKTMFKGEKNEK